MLPILGVAAVREADTWTIRQSGCSSLELMERASRSCADRILELYRTDIEPGHADLDVVVLAGPGNNGGDGLAIARMLFQAGARVQVLQVQQVGVHSPDRETNLERVVKLGVEVAELTGQNALPSFSGSGILVDALFGAGLSRAIRGWLAEVVEAANAGGREIIAIDAPSGLLLEPIEGEEAGAVINAHRTLTFEVPKLPFFFAENARFVGEWEVLPIGLDAGFIQARTTEYHLVQAEDVMTLLQPRPRFAHKGSFGHALVVAGGPGKMGAAILAIRSALRSGVGLVTARVPEEGRVIVQTAAPEAMCVVTDASNARELPRLDAFASVGIGPGIGFSDDMVLIVKNLLRLVAGPCVIDADALNILADNPTWLAFLPKDTVLTPHPKEFDRLTGITCATGQERLMRVRESAVRWRCHIVLKGAWTAICDPTGRVLFNPTGNPGMAKGGSGDVLTGLLTGLLGQGYAPREACVLGVYLHGLAGDLAAARLGMDGMTAMDLVEELPAAWRALREGSE